MNNVCDKCSGLVANIENLQDTTRSQEHRINKIDNKLNLILGAAICSPALVTILTYLFKISK